MSLNFHPMTQPQNLSSVILYGRGQITRDHRSAYMSMVFQDDSSCLMFLVVGFGVCLGGNRKAGDLL